MTRKKKVVKTDMQTYLDIFRLKIDAKLSDRQIAQALNIDLNQRAMKHYNGLSREQLFNQLDGPALQPLPAYPYEYTDHRIAKVAKDYHVQYDSHWYSVPHRLVGEKVEVIASQVLIKVHHKG